ncbi:MAG: hypothetical protein QOI95_85 [Acidimicrobiaceae bacterium]|jgi:hypothetical protein
MTIVTIVNAVGAAHPYSDELQKQAFLLCSAGLGVSFAILYRISRQVANATYDEAHNFQVTIKLVLGLTSGTILAQLVPIDSVGQLGTLTKPTLALIGGFSSSLVFRVLTRLVESVEGLFAPDAEQQAEIAQRESTLKLRDANSSIVGDLIRVRSLPPPAIAVELDNLIERLNSNQPTP